jgi:hypothetical protein
MDRAELLDAHKEAAAALQAGIKIAQRSAKIRRGADDPGRLDGRSLGALLADPGAFWGAAVAVEVQADGEAVPAIVQAARLASARAAVGDLDFIRESLIGQSQWLGALAVKLAQTADLHTKIDRQVLLLKLAMQAQRQAAQTLASAAALNKLAAADAVTVGG